MPHYSRDPRFDQDFQGLSTADARAFLRAKDRFVKALKAATTPPRSLGIHQMVGHPGLYEFRYSARGRAIFEYLTEERGPDAHVHWRRIGTHAIYDNP